MKGDSGFSYKLAADRSRTYLRLVHDEQPGKRIRPATDFPIIMDHICQRTAAKWCPQYSAALEMQKSAMYAAK